MAARFSAASVSSRSAPAQVIDVTTRPGAMCARPQPLAGGSNRRPTPGSAPMTMLDRRGWRHRRSSRRKPEI
jgi:hypothetical protein